MAAKNVSGRRWIVAAAVVVLLVVALLAAMQTGWAPRALALLDPAAHDAKDSAQAGKHSHAQEAGHQYDHQADDQADALALSRVAWKNIRLKTGIVQPETYVRTVPVPAIVVERPGRSQVAITAPMAGIVSRVYPLEAEAIQPGQRLFDVRLTHEDLVSAQRDFLQTAQQLDVIEREIQRLQSVSEGVIAGRRIVEQQYEREKLQATLHAQRQALLLHGLSSGQVEQIQQTRELLQILTVAAPPFDETSDHHEVEHLYHVQSIQVKRGQYVEAGAPLAILGDHCLLYVEGQAFEDDAQRLTEAASRGRRLEVLPVGAEPEAPLRLELLYVADQVDAASRSLRFYLSLPNQLVRDQSDDGHRFVAWQYRPGQRLEVKIPLGEAWENQIVLPPQAVVEEGAEAFVFEQKGDHFRRVPVHIVYRDNDAVVIENDRSLIGRTLAMSGAYQMHLALKNKTLGAADLHGHTH